ncbi:beta strand repeat-containing protein [Dulcicalothrix desertica]|uniref:beta strand repeat-containing protein n=1 Tax=Dulcicalothrix desertica TaxID=32056 RepID=UPI00119A1A43|nr:hypothetical protein [Dulcicalothrix desertica]TWH39301.1 hypothetical protein CAL7102_08522 [Dulcicalothrix desertica PCC 7102]
MDIIQPITNQFNTNFSSSDLQQFASTNGLNSQIPQQKITTSLSSDLTQGLNDTFPVYSLTDDGNIIYLGGTKEQAVPLSNSNNIDPLTGQTLNKFSGNSLSFLGTERVDNLYLKVGADQIFEFSTDGVNFAQVDGLTLSADTKISVDLGSGDDGLYVDSSLVNALKSTGAKLSFDGGQGNDTLFGPNLDTTWNITGYNSGNFDSIEFRGVDNLKAAANNYATFVFTPDGNLSGVADGGDGNLGTLVIEGGTYNTTKFIAFGPHSGEIYLDSKIIRYAGLAPIFDNTVTADRVFTATDGDDQILVTRAATGQTSIFSSNGTFESISFFNPSNSLTIKGLGGNDRITVDSLDPNFTKLLIIDGNDGNDSVIFSKNLTVNGGNLTVNAENIAVNNGVIIDITKPGGIDGVISFTASDTKSSFNASGQAQINLSGATIKAGNINISATSAVTSSVTSLPVALVNLASTANIAVIDSRIESSGNVTIASSSTVTGTAIAQGLSSYVDTSVDAAVATSIINSSAIARISGTSSITAGGTLAVTATNKINATTSGDASAAMGGAGIAVTTVTSTTQAYIDTSSSQSISALDLTLLADSDNNITTTAKASSGGSTKNDQTPLSRTENNAKTSDGSVDVAGALAFTKLSSKTEAYISSTNSSTSPSITTSTLTIHATSKNNSSAVADGSTVGSGASGVGVAVGINLADVTNKAYVGSNTSLKASTITIEALTPTKNSFIAEAISGAGSSSQVGVAGALALNKLNTSSQALLQTGAVVDASGKAVVLKAENNTSSTTKAEAAQTGTGTVGVGASVAINIEQNRTEAALEDNATLTNAGDSTLTATSDNSSATSVKAGSAGNISVTPALALTIVSNDTLATIGAGGTLTVGSLDAVAKHSGNTSANADAAAAGNTVGVGATFGFNIVDDTTIATTARNITSIIGDISFGAYAYAATGATAKAGAAGADPDAEKKEGQETSEDQANEQIDNEDNPNAQKHKDAIKGKAKTSSGSISIAAGLALNLVDSTAKATLADGLVINSAGSFKLATSNETDAAAIADGSAVGGAPKVGVGVAVALNIVDTTNEATVGKSTIGTANVTAKGITLEAKMSDASLKGDGFSNFTAQATAGAGASNVGVAGAFALNAIGENSSIALIKSGAIVDAGGGDVNFIAENKTNSVTLAEAEVEAVEGGKSKVGVGASIAIDVEQNRAEASLQDNSTLINAGKLTLAATSDNSSETSVKAGSAGDISVSPAVALTIVSNDTLARIGTGGTLTVGSLDAVAKHSGNTSTTADAAAAGSTVGVGAALSLNIVDDTTIATTARNITSTVGDISFGAYAYAATGATAKAGAAGADPSAEEQEGENTAEDQANAEIDSVEDNPNSAKHKDGIKGKAKTSSGSISIAAGLALNLVDSHRQSYSRRWFGN